jgi:hypothetical protein
MIEFTGTSFTISLNHTYYSAIADLHTFQFTAAHALRFSASTSRFPATDLNTETSASNNYEAFLPFPVRSPWNPGTQLKTLLDPAPWRLRVLDSRLLSYDWLVTALNEFCHSYMAAERTWSYSKHISRDRYPANPLARLSDLQKTQLPLLLRVGQCLQSCCLATRWLNSLQYVDYVRIKNFEHSRKNTGWDKGRGEITLSSQIRQNSGLFCWAHKTAEHDKQRNIFVWNCSRQRLFSLQSAELYAHETLGAIYKTTRYFNLEEKNLSTKRPERFAASRLI